MPYMMGGFPDPERSRAIAPAYADAGADLVELGVPFSDPLADGPVIHAAATAALRAGATLARVLEIVRRAGRARAGGAHVLRQPDPRPGHRALPRRAARGRGQRPDRARPAARGGRRDARRAATRAASPWCRSWRRPRRASAWPRSAPARAAFSTRSRSPAPPASARASTAIWPGRGPRRGPHRCARRGRFWHPGPEQAAAAAAAGADGVIVGSRLVRAGRGGRRPRGRGGRRARRGELGAPVERSAPRVRAGSVSI